MKKNLLITAAIAFTVANMAANTQHKIKEGKIKYEMTYPDSGSKELHSMMPKDMIIYFKNGDTRTEMKMVMGNVSIIHDAKSGDNYNLMDMMGHKMAMKMSKEDIAKFKDAMPAMKPDVKITNETKSIAGITCTKAIVTMMFNGEKKTFDAWFTKEIDALNDPDRHIDGIDGFTMEMTTVDKGVTVHALCTAIEQYAVPDSLFKIPPDYKITTMEDMVKDMKEEQSPPTNSPPSDSSLDRFYNLSDLAKEAFKAGEIEKASKYANELLETAPKYPDDWNYGNAINNGNNMLGLIALKHGDTKKAIQYLYNAGGTKGSPQLNSFGPNMSLAKELLEKGEKDAVLKFFELCRKFWKSGGEKLDHWTEDVKAGKTPYFGANILY